MRPARLRIAHAMIPLFTSFIAACGGGGGGGATASSVEPGVNEGTYDAASFGYEDPKPAWFHPLGKPTFAAVRRDEVACLVTAGGTSVMVEDAVTGTATYPTLPAAATVDFAPIDSTSGDLDNDGKPELIVIGSYGPPEEKGLRVRVLGMIAGAWTLLGSFDVGAPGEIFLVGRVDVGDVDGDSRDEIVVAATRLDGSSCVKIFEDPIQGVGLGVLLHAIELPATREVRAITAQLDDDPAKELIIGTCFGANSCEVRVFDDATTGYAPLLAPPLYSGTGILSVDLVALNRDDDTRDEIAVLRTTSAQKVQVDLYQDAVDGFDFIATSLPHAAGLWSAEDPRRMRRAAAGDLTGDGKDELVYFVLRSVSGLAHRDVVVYWGTGETVKHDASGSGTLDLYTGWDIAVVDRDADGIAEVVFADVFHSEISGPNVQWQSLKFDGGEPTKLKLAASGNVAVGGTAAQIVIAGDDFDMDGVRMRWKGVKFQRLPNPIPITVLCAPPTKKGISQNYDGSDVSYSTSSSTETAYETTTGTSLSLALGLAFEDPTGQFSASFKVSVKGAQEKSLSETSVVEKSTTFTGAHDDDVVIFEGTLHMIYVYEFVAAANPKAIGTEVTINVPLGKKVYKWTRTFFNDTFGANSTLPAGIFTHAVGNPKSYPSHDDAASLLAKYEGFEGDSMTLGQGHGSNGLGLSMEESIGIGNKWTLEVEKETEAKIGGPTVGVTFASSNEWVWQTTVTSGTSYDGTVGDISDPDEYFKWAYDVGLFTYRRVEDGELPVQVVTFWTNPWGQGY